MLFNLIFVEIISSTRARHCQGDRKGIRPVKNWMFVCWWWWFDWSFARLIAPVVQLSPPPPSSFASINTGLPRFTWKMAVKTDTERESSTAFCHIQTDYFVSVPHKSMLIIQSTLQLFCFKHSEIKKGERERIRSPWHISPIPVSINGPDSSRSKFTADISRSDRWTNRTPKCYKNASDRCLFVCLLGI